MSVRRDPFETMERMFEEMRRSGFGGKPFGHERGESAYDANVSLERSEDGFVVMADLPGFEREEIDLTYADRTLTITGTHEASEGDAYRSRTVRETVAVPEDVDYEAIEATYKNGVLEVTLPVDDESGRGYHIDIN